MLIDYNLAVMKARTAEEESPELRMWCTGAGISSSRFSSVASRTAFQSGSADAPFFETPDAADLWNVWNAEKLKNAASRNEAAKKGWLSTRSGFKELLAACASRWCGVEEVLTILKDSCSIAAAYVDLDGEELEAKLCDL
ncbi:BQ5605_C014g07708 [Microbotryum silenes-dioicae]|uniref:BQ5605_C014g07708 protein n=1 Tax=Microbotryum silenes-dioicae TaxID=796604 RepID=A0A2X0LUL5_9BASI|nr:BQ5605_C014g07708 [Microbotryum silenes-dioicae]